MAYLVLVIKTDDSITEIDGKVNNPGNAKQAGNKMDDYVRRVVSGAVGATSGATIQATVRDTDPSVATSGVGSTQNTYTYS